MKITELNSTTLKGIREALNLSLESTRQLTGLNLKVGNITYTDSNFTAKIEGALVNENGTVQSKERTDFKNYCFRWGLNPDDLGKKFNHLDGIEYEVTGCKPRSRKYPILAKRLSDGKIFKFPHTTIKFHLHDTNKK